MTIQAQILELMQELAEEFGTALIIITHNLGVVARYAHRVIVMYAGKIIETGTAAEIYHNPRHPYTIGLLASVPRLDENERVKLQAIEGLPPNLVNMPEGCAFAARCAFANEKCLQEQPSLMNFSDDHTTACWRFSELRELAEASS